MLLTLCYLERHVMESKNYFWELIFILMPTRVSRRFLLIGPLLTRKLLFMTLRVANYTSGGWPGVANYTLVSFCTVSVVHRMECASTQPLENKIKCAPFWKRRNDMSDNEVHCVTLLTEEYMFIYDILKKPSAYRCEIWISALAGSRLLFRSLKITPHPRGSVFLSSGSWLRRSGSFFMHFCPGAITTYAESINSDLHRGLDRRLRHTQHWTPNRTEPGSH